MAKLDCNCVQQCEGLIKVEAEDIQLLFLLPDLDLMRAGVVTTLYVGTWAQEKRMAGDSRTQLQTGLGKPLGNLTPLPLVA